MKKLENTDIFREELPLWREYQNEKVFYKKNNRLSVIHPVISNYLSNREPICCFGVCEAEMLGGSHLRCENTSLFSMEFIDKGSLYVRRDSDAWFLSEGEIFLIRPGGVSEMKTPQNGFCHKLSIPIAGRGVPDFLRMYDLDRKDIVSDVNPEIIRDLIRDFIGNLRFTGIENHMRATALLLRLFQLLRYGRSLSRIPEKLSSLVLQFEQSPEKEFTLPEMADVCGCSVTHLIRLFRTWYHCSPHRKLTEIRMNHAAMLLIQTQNTVKEIADLSGYSNAMNFATEFRKFFHMSPGQYRKKAPFLNMPG